MLGTTSSAEAVPRSLIASIRLLEKIKSLIGNKDKLMQNCTNARMVTFSYLTKAAKNTVTKVMLNSPTYLAGLAICISWTIPRYISESIQTGLLDCLHASKLKSILEPRFWKCCSYWWRGVYEFTGSVVATRWFIYHWFSWPQFVLLVSIIREHFEGVEYVINTYQEGQKSIF